MEKITFGESNIETIGLLFEPNFFHIYCYSDLEGANFVKTVSCRRDKRYDFSELQSMNHLFATITKPHWTLVPTAIFRDEDAKNYLELNSGYVGNSTLSSSVLDGLESTLIYERDEEAEKLVSKIQPALETKHLASVLLEYGRRRVSKSEKDFLHVQVLDQLAIISIFRKGSLLLANSIEVDKAEDLIYYIFYTLKKLDISIEIQAEFGGSGKLLTAVRNQAAKFLTNVKQSNQQTEGNELAEIIPRCA